VEHAVGHTPDLLHRALSHINLSRGDQDAFDGHITTTVAVEDAASADRTALEPEDAIYYAKLIESFFWETWEGQEVQPASHRWQPSSVFDHHDPHDHHDEALRGGKAR